MRYLFSYAILLLLPLAASAHAVIVEAKLKGATVAVEAFYDDNTPAADAKITVEDPNKNVIAEGTTDSLGLWSFPTPQPGDYTVRLDAGFGHAAKTPIHVPTPAVKEAPEEPIVISEGPSRESITGPMRVAMAVAGIAIIAALTGLLWWLSRFRTSKKP